MKKNAKVVFMNLYYTVAANFITLGISVLLNLLVPKILNVREYGYWQLYLFYSTYVGFFHFGWIDGIYLKIGGENYDDLNKQELGSQFWYLFIFEVFISFAVAVFSLIAFSDEKAIILLLTAVVSVITIMKSFIFYIFQSTNRIREYAQISRGDRFIYVAFLAIYFLIGGRNYLYLVVLDIISKLLITLWGMNRIKDMLNVSLIKFKIIVPEITDNLKIGSNLMLSNVASMLILGVFRQFVETKWSIEVFGKLSFTLSISNMFLTFINAVGVVMFPILRRTNPQNLSKVYLMLRNLFVPITYICLLLFMPSKIILEMWLPQYKESLLFMGILFPMVIYEGRMSLLINTYLKTIRKEKTILKVNLVALLLTVVVSWITVFIFDDLKLTVVAIILVIAFRCIYAELSLATELDIAVIMPTIFESLLTAVFICGNLFLDERSSILVYTLALIVYILLSRKLIYSSFKDFKTLVKN